MNREDYKPVETLYNCTGPQSLMYSIKQKVGRKLNSMSPVCSGGRAKSNVQE